jgi:hypothetical protein
MILHRERQRAAAAAAAFRQPLALRQPLDSHEELLARARVG